MSRKAHGQIRQGQVITTYGPGALIDLPRHSSIVGGLDTWPKPGDLQEIDEPRLARRLEIMTGVSSPRLYAPPPNSNDPRETARGIGAWRFPEWFVVQDERGERGGEGRGDGRGDEGGAEGGDGAGDAKGRRPSPRRKASLMTSPSIRTSTPAGCPITPGDPRSAAMVSRP